MKRTIYINVNDDIDGAVTLLPQNAIQVIQDVLEYGESIGKTSIQTESINWHINRAIMHACDFSNSFESEQSEEDKFEAISHMATRSIIALQKYIEERKKNVRKNIM